MRVVARAAAPLHTMYSKAETIIAESEITLNPLSESSRPCETGALAIVTGVRCQS